MTKQPFEPKVEEDLNRPYNVTLTEGQISTILWSLEGYIQGNDDYDEESEYGIELNSIFEVLENAVDSYYDEQKQIAQALYDAQQKQPIPEWDETTEDAQENNVPYSTLNEDEDRIIDYASRVDALVDSMKEGG